MDDYKVKIGHLQEAVKTHFSALTSLKQQCTALKKEKDDANRLIEEYKLKYSDLETGMMYECTDAIIVVRDTYTHCWYCIGYPMTYHLLFRSIMFKFACYI